MKNKKAFELNNELLKFYKAAKKEFKNVKKVDIDGEIIDEKCRYSGLCGFLSANYTSFFTDMDVQFNKISKDIKNRIEVINESKKYTKTYITFVWFPTNEIRMNFINNQIKKYQKKVDTK